MKSYCLVDNFDKKSNKVQLNDFLIKFAKLELEKVGIILERDFNNESIKFTLLKKEKVNPLQLTDKKGNLCLNDFSDIKEENSLLFSTDKKAHKLSVSSNVSSNKLSVFQAFNKFVSDYNFNKNVILLIDNREGRQNKETGLFFQKIKEQGINCEEKTLSIGDFLWIYRDDSTGMEYVLDYIIERKTIDDLAKSIVDGRYDEQKYRLKNCGLKNIYYLFEGFSLSTSHYSIQKSAIQSAIIHTINIHDINIIKTSNLKDSIISIKKMHEIISKVNFDTRNLQNFTQFTLKNLKNKNSSVEKIFSRQLRCVTITFKDSLINVEEKVLSF